MPRGVTKDVPKTEKEKDRETLHKALDEYLNYDMSVCIIARYPKGGWGYIYNGDARGLYGAICKIHKHGLKHAITKARP